MAKDEWKEAIRKNMVFFKTNITEPEHVADYLHGEFTPPVLTTTMMEDIRAKTTRTEKVVNLLEILPKRGPRVLLCLYEALMKTGNEQCARKLVPYIEQQKSLNAISKPSEWPPPLEELKTMWSRPPRYLMIDDPEALHYPMPNEQNRLNYSMTKKKRGFVLLINNEKFSEAQKFGFREGSTCDANELEKTFRSLHFDVIHETNLTAKQIVTKTKETRDTLEQTTSDCFVFIILSHGDQCGIYGTDGNPVQIEQLTDMFRPINCRSLDEKPKIFLIQACRGEKKETTESFSTTSNSSHHDGFVRSQIIDAHKTADQKDASTATSTRRHSYTDFLIAYSSPEESVSYRNPQKGSWFMQAIVWIFKSKAYSEDIAGMLTEVNNLVSMGRAKTKTPGTEAVTASNNLNYLRKRLFFYPGLYGEKKVHPDCYES